MAIPAIVALTDIEWFRHLEALALRGPIDEVNFWRPRSRKLIRAIHPGEPLFLRLHAPACAIVGFGFLAAQHVLTIRMAWQLFGERNGARDFEEFVKRIVKYRELPLPDGMGVEFEQRLCVILRDPVFLPREEWIPWREGEGWAANSQTYKKYDLSEGPGRRLHDLLARVHPQPVPEFEPAYRIFEGEARPRVVREVAERQGQGAFRLRLLSAYGGRCAITGEHSEPALDAAHIQPYLGPRSNHVQNGLVLRADLHRLYDEGYVAVTPDYRFRVSPKLKKAWDNGKIYYDLQESLKTRKILLPRAAAERPSPAALEWHVSQKFIAS